MLPAPALAPTGRLIALSAVPPDGHDLARLDRYARRPDAAGTGAHHRQGSVWRIFRAAFANGVTDDLAVLLRDNANDQAVTGFFSSIWPILREDALRECHLPLPDSGSDSGPDSGPDFGDEAMLWMISNKIDIAVMVMNDKGQMLRANAAARDMLESGHVLRRGKGGIRGVDEGQTRLLRQTVAACAKAGAATAEAFVFLATATPGLRVPVTVSRFLHVGVPTDLVTVMMPSPPDSRRVERLAKRMGLTHAEARVAALLQLGLSNRVAAGMAGLKEQSFSTYAKRVLSKLNVTSRAEMAQMLTWQAQGGRMP
ncbi:LuxR C-terminal-related transcriptional regulator [Paracoccaceae bacterium Fryx2]|nr:LuxR C-terminal-related transcriptional regulator [Paracoccaceae bacterium Fryx2]